MDNDIILSCALTGTNSPRSVNPSLPVTPEEIADAAYDAWNAGASIVHLHMRDDNMEGTMNEDKFKKTIELIRSHKDCDVIINCTSSGGSGVTHNSRINHFRHLDGIEMGSLDVGSFNWACGFVFANPPMFLEELMKTYNERDIIPEIEIFDPGMIGTAREYMKRGLLKKDSWFQLVLGVLGGSDASIESLVYLKNLLPAECKWSATGIGRGHLPIMYAALAAGAGGIRVGLEDNLYYSAGNLATNTQLVSRAVRVINDFGKNVASPAKAREMLGIKPLKRD